MQGLTPKEYERLDALLANQHSVIAYESISWLEPSLVQRGLVVASPSLWANGFWSCRVTDIGRLAMRLSMLAKTWPT